MFRLCVSFLFHVVEVRNEPLQPTVQSTVFFPPQSRERSVLLSLSRTIHRGSVL